MVNKLLIGWGQRDITPDRPVNLVGQFYQRITNEIQSPISVTAMAVETNDDQMIICSCDLLSIDFEILQMVRKNVSRRTTDLNLSKIIVSATHIHTGPDCNNSVAKSLNIATEFLSPVKRPVLKQPDDLMTAQECEAFVISQISDAVVEAWNIRASSSFSAQFGRAVVGHCRRVCYNDGSSLMYGDSSVQDFDCLEGGSDSGIELIYIFDIQKQLTGIVVNVACPSQIVEHKNFISSDYWGEVRKLIHKKLGEDVNILGLCSAAGDQSPRDMIRVRTECNQDSGKSSGFKGEPSMNDVEGLAEIGKRISNVIIEKYEFARYSTNDSAKFLHRVETLKFPLRTVSEPEYLEAKEKFDEYLKTTEKEIFDTQDMVALHSWAGIMKRYEEQKNNLFYDAEIHVVRLGNLVFATNPFELFLDYGLRIKARSKAEQTFLIQLACDSGGYLPTEKAERGGHYSATVASGKTGHDGGNLLVERTLEIIDSLWEE